MKLLIFDDHKIITDAIATYVRANSDTEIIGQCHSISEVKQTLVKSVPDVVISDLLTEEDAGFTLFEYIFRRYRKVKIVVYSSVSNDFIVQSMLDIGISAYLNKREPLSALWQKVEEVHNSIYERETTNLQSIKYLTSKEKKIALMLAKGYAAKEIASKLGSSVNTINNQKNSLLAKFNCDNSTELIIKLSQMGMINIH